MNMQVTPGTAWPPRVLMLDDDPFMLVLMQDMLHSIGVGDVHAASTTRQALSTLAGQAPDMLICDLALPEMDGIEFLQAAAQQGYRGGVILLSGMDSGVCNAAGELARVLGLRVAGVYHKPITPEQLRAALAC